MTASPEIQEIAIITGASTGIGAATARELADKLPYAASPSPTDLVDGAPKSAGPRSG